MDLKSIVNTLVKKGNQKLEYTEIYCFCLCMRAPSRHQNYFYLFASTAI